MLSQVSLFSVFFMSLIHISFLIKAEHLPFDLRPTLSILYTFLAFAASSQVLNVFAKL